MDWNDGIKIVVGLILGAVLAAMVIAVAQTAGASFDLDTLGKIGAIIVAPLTLGLVDFTGLLARETRQMWVQNRAPHIVVTMEPAAVSMMYVDLVVENVGGGPAFEVVISLNPDVNVTRATRPLRVSEAAILRPPTLKPGQRLATFLGAWAEIQPPRTKVTCRCKDGSGNELVFENVVDIGMYTGIARLGEEPLHQLASEVKSIREAIDGVTRGRRLEVNTHDEAERAREQATLDAHFRSLNHSGPGSG